MAFNPAPELKKGFCFIVLGLFWFVYLLFEPMQALIAGGFLVSATAISHRKFK
jgi:hypothetical protein